MESVDQKMSIRVLTRNLRLTHSVDCQQCHSTEVARNDKLRKFYKLLSCCGGDSNCFRRSEVFLRELLRTLVQKADKFQKLRKMGS